MSTATDPSSAIPAAAAAAAAATATGGKAEPPAAAAAICPTVSTTESEEAKNANISNNASASQTAAKFNANAKASAAYASNTAKVAAAPTSANGNAGSNKVKVSVCRILITDLRAGKGYAKDNYRIELIKSKHGLYDIVSAMFGILSAKKLTNDSIYSHLWDLGFAGKTYRNGWRRQKSPWEKEYDRPPTETDLDEGEPRLLGGLKKPIKKGMRGWCKGESAQFEFVVEDASVEVEVKGKEVEDSKPSSEEEELGESKTSFLYPRVTPVKIQLSTKLEADWVTSHEQSQVRMLTSAWQTYMSGENSWKRNRSTGEWIPGKPIPPTWQGDEVKIMSLLLNSGCKFKKSWTNILKFAFVDRNEGSTSGQWYKLQKEVYRREYHGRGKSNGECICLAKRSAKSLLGRYLKQGPPKRKPHPWKGVENALRKRKKIDDSTSPAEKRQMCAMYVGILSDVEDSDADH